MEITKETRVADRLEAYGDIADVNDQSVTLMESGSLTAHNLGDVEGSAGAGGGCRAGSGAAKSDSHPADAGAPTAGISPGSG